MKNSFLFSAIFIFISAGLYSQVIKPWFGDAYAKYEQVEVLKSVFLQGQNLQTKRDALRSELNAVPRRQQDLIENAIPTYSQGNLILFLLALDKLEERSGLPLDTKYNIGTERKSEDQVLLPISFNFGEVSYDTLRQFINNIQQWDRGVRIQSVQIGLPADEDLAERGFVQATISMEALFSAASETLQ